MKKDLEKIFSFYASGGSIFAKRDFLQSSYIPDKLPHRESQIRQLAQILATALRLEVPSNVLIYGKPGTGKTAVVRYVGSNLQDMANKKHITLNFMYINAGLKKVADTEYRLYAHICRLLGTFIPDTGIPTGSVFNKMVDLLDARPAIYIIAVDELDILVEKSPETIYTLSRINSELKNSKVSIIGVTNDLNTLNNLDARAKSSLSEEEILFPPYDANQLKDILEERSAASFSPGVVDDSVILLCSASAAKEHGDARRALELLKKSAELAEREASGGVSKKHVELAIGKLNSDKVLSFVKMLPHHQKIVLKALMDIDKPVTFTREVYDKYVGLTKALGVKELTMRRVLDILGEFESAGIAETHVISRGRYGRTKVVELKTAGNIKDWLEKYLVDLG